MTQPIETHLSTDQLPRISQKLRLTCKSCGTSDTYDVGTVFYDQEGEGESAKTRFAFTNYFRCRKCNSAGPWDVADYLKLIGLTLRKKVQPSYQGVFVGRTALFDGTFTQTPADGEDHLLRLIVKDPRNAFLHTRVGNLLRGCGERTRAAEWYEKAVALDPGDVEARYHLYSFATDDRDFPGALRQVQLLVRHLLAGRTTNKEDLTYNLALVLVDELFKGPQEVRDEFLGKPRPMPEPPERTFIRTLLEQEGVEEEIIQKAANRLLDGQAEPGDEELEADESAAEGPLVLMTPDAEDEPLTTELVPSLREVVDQAGLDAQKLTVALVSDEQGRDLMRDRQEIHLFDGTKAAVWTVASLAELFRGHQSPPADMDHYPPAYCPYFYFIEKHLLTLGDSQGDRSDQEMEEIYSALRRRPGRKSLGPTHDFFWQVCALMLGQYVLSQAEFEAIVGTLEHSARKWALRPISRNYLHYLRSNLP